MKKLKLLKRFNIILITLNPKNDIFNSMLIFMFYINIITLRNFEILKVYIRIFKMIHAHVSRK